MKFRCISLLAFFLVHLKLFDLFPFRYSNDKNLCSKALLSGVQALSKADLQKQAEVNPVQFHQRYGQISVYPHATSIKQPQQGDMLHISFCRIYVSFFKSKTHFAQGTTCSHLAPSW